MPDEEVQTKVEDVQEEEAQEEAKADEEPDQLEEIRLELAELKKSNGDLEARYKDISGKLTRTQQENSEFVKFIKTKTIPEENKKFEDRWEDDPQKAVQHEVTENIKGTEQEIARLNATSWMTAAIQRDPEKSKYRERAIELSIEHPSLSYSENGINRLLDLAEADDMREELKKVRSNNRAEGEKTRAYTESSTPRTPPKPKLKATAEEARVAEQLGVKLEDYLKQKERIGRGIIQN